jgi:hypothetical protein
VHLIDFTVAGVVGNLQHIEFSRLGRAKGCRGPLSVIRRSLPGKGLSLVQTLLASTALLG